MWLDDCVGDSGYLAMSTFKRIYVKKLIKEYDPDMGAEFFEAMPVGLFYYLKDAFDVEVLERRKSLLEIERRQGTDSDEFIEGVKSYFIARLVQDKISVCYEMLQQCGRQHLK